MSTMYTIETHFSILYTVYTIFIRLHLHLLRFLQNSHLQTITIYSCRTQKPHSVKASQPQKISQVCIVKT